jgi:protein-glucosylgalactosylhydroxylysine glucosidase
MPRVLYALLAAAAAAQSWKHWCDSCAAVSPDCPYLDHGDGSSLAACQASCVGEISCNLVNVDLSIGDCVLRACTDPAAPTLTNDSGYSVYGLPSRPTPPPGCGPRSSRRTVRFRAAAPPPAERRQAPPPRPPAAWQADIDGANKLWAPDDSGLDPQYDLPQVGNGFLGTQVMTDAVIASGLYNGVGTVTPSHRARIPSGLSVPSPTGNTSASAWDVLRATYYRRSYIAPSGGGGGGGPAACTAASNVTCTTSPTGVWVEQRWYAHRGLPSVLVMEVEVLPSFDESTDGDEVGADAATPLPEAGAPPFAMVRLTRCPASDSADIAFADVPVPPGASYTAAVGFTLLPETNTSGTQGLAVVASAWPAGDMLPVTAARVTYALLMVVRTTVETPVTDDLVPAAVADYRTAVALAANGTLHATHVAAWADSVWPGGVEVGGGRADVARVVNASLAALAGSVRADRHYPPSPSGLSGAGNTQTGYSGHFFWDFELWMAPALVAVMPDLAAAGVAYRAARLAGAAAKAASYTPPYAGTMFPWESAATGYETCPSWAPTGTREVHISGDVAVAVWWAYRTLQQPGNTTWLASVAYPLLSGVADFWVSRATPAAGSSLSIDDVIPPDEYADHVNNSAYTNAVAKLALNAAAAAARVLGRPPSEYSRWLDASAGLSVPFNATAPPGAGMDPAGGWHPEYDSYANATIKQADVVLLGYPLQAGFANVTGATRRNDLQFYAPRTDPGGPAMTWAMHAVGFLELAEAATAGALLNRSMAGAQASPFALWTETVDGGCPNFVTGAGGFLQALIYGYPGLRLNDTALTFTAPTLVDGAGSHALRGLSYLGNRLDVAYDGTDITFTLQQAAAGGGCGGAPLWRRRYAVPPVDDGDDEDDGASSLRLATDTTCQHGRVVVDGAPVAATPLVVVGGDGIANPLVPGAPVTMPLAASPFAVTADAAAPPPPLVAACSAAHDGFTDVGAW